MQRNGTQVIRLERRAAADRTEAHRALQQRAAWWESATISTAEATEVGALATIFYRLRIEKMTGHRATPPSPRNDSTWDRASPAANEPT